ncbi:glycosyltransferase family 69 protein [Serpula lacrymans var. lacrymans S7.3]|uniref:Glycosyltransferase family 69 protein n=2 Tax=Serpula lacrymans var. lacrymans TaxID=341189 RepID=F8Q2T5_SERL3|nr:glycosyltransferase family 69 protein [Serpula lacrymans var. lacrymans S7.9]EGN97496.1 glycosyltransferase family 69 protein [Serpula lacrymans var. lacrymans S7.3]EGO23098.1 glycosyltransferase family 69 protein [Serpula lacrymans var. lacrymans S7.9]
MAWSLRRHTLTRIFFALSLVFFVRLLFYPSSWNPTPSTFLEIQEYNVFERVTGSDKTLNVQKHKNLQSRMGRDERPDIFEDFISNGVADYWQRFQKPYIKGKETTHMDVQSVLTSIEHLLSLNGWVAAYCPTLARPFGQNKNQDEDAYDDLAREDHLFYIAIAIHSADHFLVDQLAVIVQLAKRLGTSNLFVSMLDYDSTDSTSTLTDLCEAVLTLLGVPFRIRRVPGMTEDPTAAYYPSEEAYMRNLALEPLGELYHKRNIKFHRVIWLKGFTCPNDILETIKVSIANEAAMVCGMDWAEFNGFFIFSDRWRTRDIHGDQFRQSRSSSKPDAVPPRDEVGAARYIDHLPFQVFCCEAGTHIVDPAQSYYKGIQYRYGEDYHNVSSSDPQPPRPSDASCLDSTQAWFCRDLWISKALEGVKDDEVSDESSRQKKKNAPKQNSPKQDAPKQDASKDTPSIVRRQPPPVDPDANAGSDYDAMPDEDLHFEDLPVGRLSIPNSVYEPARILINPRCVTTYAGVSHTQLALDLFGTGDDDGAEGNATKYVLEDWEGAPEVFVCQEQSQTGGRKASKTQRLLGFSIHDELERL